MTLEFITPKILEKFVISSKLEIIFTSFLNSFKYLYRYIIREVLFQSIY